MTLEHIALNVPDPAALARWYRDHLDLAIVVQKDTAPFEHFLADGAGSMIEVYANPKGEQPDYAAMSPFTFHLAFTVEDVEAESARLLEAGARREGDTLVNPAGDELLFLRDPWGVTLQLVRRAEPLA